MIFMGLIYMPMGLLIYRVLAMPRFPSKIKNENGIIDNFMCAIDGFLVSSNVLVERVEVVGSGENRST